MIYENPDFKPQVQWSDWKLEQTRLAVLNYVWQNLTSWPASFSLNGHDEAYFQPLKGSKCAGIKHFNLINRDDPFDTNKCLAIYFHDDSYVPSRIEVDHPVRLPDSWLADCLDRVWKKHFSAVVPTLSLDEGIQAKAIYHDYGLVTSNVSKDQSQNILVLCAQNGEIDSLRFLMDQPDLNPHGACLFHAAAEREDFQIFFDEFIARGISPHELQDESQETALHYAARSGNSLPLIALLEMGLDPHQKNLLGQSVLTMKDLSTQQELVLRSWMASKEAMRALEEELAPCVKGPQ